MLKSYFHRLQTIDRLIRIKGTGCPSELARRLNISERYLYNLLSLMRELGAPIAYNRKRSSYYYKDNGGFDFSYQYNEKDHSYLREV